MRTFTVLEVIEIPHYFRLLESCGGSHWRQLEVNKNVSQLKKSYFDI